MLQLQRSTLNENLLLQNFKQNIEKNKSHGDKRGQYYSNKIETPTRETIFVESKEETPKPITSFRTPSQCTFCKKFGHTKVDALAECLRGVSPI